MCQGWVGVPTLTGPHELTNGNPGESLSRVLALARPPEFNLVVSPTNHGRSTNRTSIEQPTTNNLDGRTEHVGRVQSREYNIFNFETKSLV